MLGGANYGCALDNDSALLFGGTLSPACAQYTYTTVSAVVAGCPDCISVAFYNTSDAKHVGGVAAVLAVDPHGSVFTPRGFAKDTGGEIVFASRRAIDTIGC